MIEKIEKNLVTIFLVGFVAGLIIVEWFNYDTPQWFLHLLQWINN